MVSASAISDSYAPYSANSEGTNVARPSLFQTLTGKAGIVHETPDSSIVEKMHQSHAEEIVGMSEMEVEKLNARRMLRVATWSTVFCMFSPLSC